MQNFEAGFAYTAHHKPSGEDWYLLGIDVNGDCVCAAGWPPSMGKLSDCENFEKRDKLTDDELKHRAKNFGYNWLSE